MSDIQPAWLGMLRDAVRREIGRPVTACYVRSSSHLTSDVDPAGVIVWDGKAVLPAFSGLKDICESLNVPD